MNFKYMKIIINTEKDDNPNWKLKFKKELKKFTLINVEIFSKSIDLSCKDIKELSEIANQYNSKIISFCSTSLKTIVSSQSLGYKSHFLVEDFSGNTLKPSNSNLKCAKTKFHQGTLRSGEYLDSPGDLLIFGDVNPGAIVRAVGNIIIWGRLLGIAHAGCEGNSRATISSLQLRPVQLRIANKVARGPEEIPQVGLAEQARIDSGKIIISVIDSF